MTATYDETLDYLESRYLTLQQLAERSGLSPSSAGAVDIGRASARALA